MLVLTREKDGAVVLHKDGKVIGIVTVNSIKGGQVRLGFSDFEGIKIDREEVYHDRSRLQQRSETDDGGHRDQRAG
jgi:carbon storage regulator CsrA